MTDFESRMMNNITVETVTKTIVSETAKWGFKPADYITLVNALMDLSLGKSNEKLPESGIDSESKQQILNLPIKGDQINIRLFDRDGDYTIVQRWLNDEAGRWFLISRSYTRDTTLNQLIEDDRNILGIITLPDSKPIGLMGFLDFDTHHHKAELRKLIGEVEFREKGYAKEATMLWLQYGKTFLKLKKIYLNTIENNIRNITLNKELGFQVEGILRQECFIDGEYYDLLRMGLTND